jgi:hypothetical protein
MIVIKASRGRIEEISFTGASAVERAIETAIWPVIEPLVERLDRKLMQTNRAVLRELAFEEKSR